MSDQGSADQTPKSGRPRHTAILLLALVVIVLWFVGSAHQCIGRDWIHETDGTGDYWGSTTIVGGPGSPHVPYIVARTGGTEFCLPDFTPLESDWDWEWTFGLGSDETTPGVVTATANGSGGYATGFFDCLTNHQIWWGAQWRWKEHGTERERSANACLVLGGPNLCAPTLF